MMGVGVKQRMARKFFESQARPLLAVIAHRERRLVEKTHELLEAQGVEPSEPPPDVEDRVDAMQGYALANLDDSVHEWFLTEVVGMENVETALKHASLEPDAWDEIKAGWASVYREEGREGSDDDLADLHVQARHGVTLAEFRDNVVAWGEAEQRRLVEDVLAAGVIQAEDAVERATERANDRGTDE